MSASAPSAEKSLYEIYQLDRLFPKENYNKEGYREYTLHFLIALDQPVKTVADYIEKTLRPKYPFRLNLGFSEHRLTPLHIAVIKGKLEYVELLIKESSVNVDEVDAYGWTPLHHAALLTDHLVIAKALINKKADEAKKTSLRATWKDLRRLAGFEATRAPSANSLYYQREDGQIENVSSMSETLMKQIGLKGITDELMFPRSELLVLWTDRPPQGEYYLFTTALKSYELFLKSSPKLLIQPDPSLPKDDSNLGLWTLQDLKRGEAIGTYSGQLLPTLDRPRSLEEAILIKPKFDDFYNFTNSTHAIFPREQGNASRYMDDGFPNMTFTLLPVQENRFLAITLEDIPKGSRLTWNYKLVLYLKWGHYRILRKKEMEDFFKKMSPQNALQLLMKDFHFLRKQIPLEGKTLSTGTLSIYAEHENLKEKLRYLYHTPAAGIYLSLKQIVSAKEWLELPKEPVVGQNVLQVSPSSRQHYTWIIQTYWILSEFEELLKSIDQVNKDLAQEIRDFFLLKLEACKIVDIIAALYKSQRSFISNQPASWSLKMWSDLKEELNVFFQKYEWEKDEKFPLPRKIQDIGQQTSSWNIFREVNKLLKSYGDYFLS